MKVKDLIKELQNQNPESTVVIDGYEGGVDDIDIIKPIKINLNVRKKHQWYYGKHEVSKDEGVDALYLATKGSYYDL
jgi:hypothetical protein